MRRTRLTPSAKADLADLAAFIAGESPTAALRVSRRLRAEMRRLARQPGLGHRREDLADEALRAWIVYSYLVIYRADTKPLQIVRVLHSSRDVRRAMGRSC